MTVPSQDQIDAFAEASKRPSIREIVSQSSFATIACMLRSLSSDMKSTISPNIRNIQPIDCDQMAELLDAVAERFEQLFASIVLDNEMSKSTK
ncbi:MAG: hypothetical protein IKJ37_01140 [Kiritimatiellae bacterium]|nr:hypothetical protein [Kiritimatiellia bacterium]